MNCDAASYFMPILILIIEKAIENQRLKMTP